MSACAVRCTDTLILLADSFIQIGKLKNRSDSSYRDPKEGKITGFAIQSSECLRKLKCTASTEM